METARGHSPAAPETQRLAGRSILMQRSIDSPLHEQSLAAGNIAAISRRHPHKSTSNEDAAAILSVSKSTGVVVVADGVGGNRGGDTASGALVESLRDVLLNHADSYPSLRTAVLDAIEDANQRILDTGIGAATTAAIVEVQGDRIRPYHVGDSMILVVGQKGKVKYQTVSHSPVGFAVEAGLLDEQEAMYHEHRHLVSNVVGSNDMRIEIGPQLTLAKRDTVLLATDGLFDNLHIDEIVEIIRKGPLKEGVEQLLTESVRRMTQPNPGEPSKADDATIVAFRLKPIRRRPAVPAPETPVQQPVLEHLTDRHTISSRTPPSQRPTGRDTDTPQPTAIQPAPPEVTTPNQTAAEPTQATSSPAEPPGSRTVNSSQEPLVDSKTQAATGKQPAQSSDADEQAGDSRQPSIPHFLARLGLRNWAAKASTNWSTGGQ